jgi:ATP-dependent DNA helicase RecG
LRTGTSQVNTQDGHVNGHVNRKNEIIAALKDNPQLTLRQIAEIANISYRTVRCEMDDLREKGIVKRIGSDKTGHWEVIAFEKSFPK